MTTTLTVATSAFRAALGRFATGLTVVSGTDRGRPVGFTCQAFASVSLEPPLVSFCVARSSTTYPRIHRNGHFAVSVLAEDQRWIAEQLAGTASDKWRGVCWHPTPRGNPVVCGALVWLDCSVVAEHPAGDHTIVVGEVGALDSERPEAGPLVYHQSRYGALSDVPDRQRATGRACVSVAGAGFEPA